MSKKGNKIENFQDFCVIYTSKNEQIFVDIEDIEMLSKFT